MTVFRTTTSFSDQATSCSKGSLSWVRWNIVRWLIRSRSQFAQHTVSLLSRYRDLKIAATNSRISRSVSAAKHSVLKIVFFFFLSKSQSEFYTLCEIMNHLGKGAYLYLSWFIIAIQYWRAVEKSTTHPSRLIFPCHLLFYSVGRDMRINLWWI